MGVQKMDRLTRVRVEYEMMQGKQTRRLLAVPAHLQLVQDLERHLFSRLGTADAQQVRKLETLTLSVDGFALPSAERLQDVLRDGDLVTARSTPAPKINDSAKLAHPCKLDDVLSTPPTKVKSRSRSHRRQRCQQVERVLETPPSSGALPSSSPPPRPVAPQTAKSLAREVAKETTLAAIITPASTAEAEAKKKSGEDKTTRFHMKAPGAGVNRRDWTQSGGQDGQPVVVQHPHLGELEVPEGMDAEIFVLKKLKTLQKAVRRQVEYYFSDANWAKDEHLQSQADGDGHVSFDAIMDFERLRTLTSNSSFARECMEGSKVVEISPCGTKLRRSVRSDSAAHVGTSFRK